MSVQPKKVDRALAGLSVAEQAAKVEADAKALEATILALSTEARDRIGTHFLGAALRGARAAGMGAEQLRKALARS